MIVSKRPKKKPDGAWGDRERRIANRGEGILRNFLD